MKLMSIYGSRPQHIKVLDNLDNHILVNVGQHYDYDMSGIFEKQLKLRPKYNLNATELGQMIEKCSEVIKKENPDVVIVYGDTRSTLAGALATKFQGKMLVHIESGMRSYDMSQLEEVIRVIVDKISNYRFCANEFARENLRKEAIYDNVFVVGDPMWDSLNRVLPIPKSKDYGQYNVLTIHREQNDNENSLNEIFEALKENGGRFVFPVHPRLKRSFKKFKIKIPKNVEMIKPQGYKEMIKLMTNCKKVITDSGGLTREAYWFGKPVIILRWETEWNEIVKDGWGILVGTDKNKILDALKNFNPVMKVNPRNYMPIFGAKEKIKEILYG